MYLISTTFVTITGLELLHMYQFDYLIKILKLLVVLFVLNIFCMTYLLLIYVLQSQRVIIYIFINIIYNNNISNTSTNRLNYINS